jgi:hypothetical protein
MARCGAHETSSHHEERHLMKQRLALTLAASALVACAGGETKESDSAAAASAAPNLVTITARDFTFDAPDTIPAGVTTIRLAVEAGLHHAQLLKFSEGKTLTDFIAAMQTMKPGDAPPSWAEDVGGPNPPQPGEAASVTQTLEPGNYAVVCFVDVPDKVPHVMKGMAKAFVVVPSTATAAEPVADVTMQLVDYAFNLSTPLTAGQRTIRVENGAQQTHEVFVAQLLPGRTMADFAKWAETFQGPPPMRALGGVAGLKPGLHSTFTVELTPGDYALICFIPDKNDGKLHLEHGMVLPFKIG